MQHPDIFIFIFFLIVMYSIISKLLEIKMNCKSRTDDGVTLEKQQKKKNNKKMFMYKY